MSEPTDAGDRPLQFDAAEPTGASEPLACSACRSRIRGVYHEANGAVVCARCRVALERRLHGGSSAARFTKALTFGAGAAALGAALYFGIAFFFGYELALIAIVVGWMVGKAVSSGSSGRGGWRYQTLAIALTYGAIVVTYMPGAMARSMGVDPSLLADSAAVDSALADAERRAAQEPGEGATLALGEPADSAGAQAPGAEGIPAGAAMAIGLAFMFVLAWAEPFRQLPANIIGLLIIAIGLHQAWSLNRAARIAITGPYSLGEPRPPSA